MEIEKVLIKILKKSNMMSHIRKIKPVKLERYRECNTVNKNSNFILGDFDDICGYRLIGTCRVKNEIDRTWYKQFIHIEIQYGNECFDIYRLMGYEYLKDFIGKV